jgi:hypothetical protein
MLQGHYECPKMWHVAKSNHWYIAEPESFVFAVTHSVEQNELGISAKLSQMVSGT